MASSLNQFFYINPTEETFLWKRLSIPNIDVMHDEMIRHVEKPSTQANMFSKTGMTFNYTDETALLKDCPTLLAWLQQNDLKLTATALVDVPKFRIRRPVHVDNTWRKFPNNFALNFPLTNCVSPDVWTAMFRVQKGPGTMSFPITTESDRLGVWNSEDCVEITRFQYIDKQPVLFNAKVPHGVVNGTDQARCALSLRFVKDPIHLTHD
jgi:hypothetical protein